MPLIFKIVALVASLASATDSACKEQDGQQCEEQSSLLQLQHGDSIETDSDISAQHAQMLDAIDVIETSGCRDWAKGLGNPGYEEAYRKTCKAEDVCDTLVEFCEDCKVTEENCEACPRKHFFACKQQPKVALTREEEEKDFSTPQPSWPGGCSQYCDVFMAQCDVPSNPVGRYYRNRRECLHKCSKIPVTRDEIQNGNTMACRAFHAALSQVTSSFSAFHCNHAFFKDPMFICRNVPLPGFKGHDLREVIFNTRYVKDGGYGTSGDVCSKCKCNAHKTVINCQPAPGSSDSLSQSEFMDIVSKLPRSVKVLDFSVNNITKIAANTFARLPNLVGLSLSNNPFLEFDAGCFNGLTKLVSLLIDFTNIQLLSPGIMDPLVSLVELSATGNTNMANITAGTFDKTTKLQFAILFGSFRPTPNSFDPSNSYDFLPADLFKNTHDLFLLSTVVTNMGSNSWPTGILNTVPKLEQLHINLNGPPCTAKPDGYDSATLPQAIVDGISNMPALTTFAFWGCPELTTIPENLFAKNPKLELVYMFNNGITFFPEQLFANQNSLQIVALDANDITLQCSYAVRQVAKFGVPGVGGPGVGGITGREALPDLTGYVCKQACVGLCPMIQTLRLGNKGVWVNFGNYRKQTPDDGKGFPSNENNTVVPVNITEFVPRPYGGRYGKGHHR